MSWYVAEPDTVAACIHIMYVYSPLCRDVTMRPGCVTCHVTLDPSVTKCSPGVIVQRVSQPREAGEPILMLLFENLLMAKHINIQVSFVVEIMRCRL